MGAPRERGRLHHRAPRHHGHHGRRIRGELRAWTAGGTCRRMWGTWSPSPSGSSCGPCRGSSLEHMNVDYVIAANFHQFHILCTMFITQLHNYQLQITQSNDDFMFIMCNNFTSPPADLLFDKFTVSFVIK